MLLQHNDHSTVRNVRLKNLFSRTCCRNSPSVRLVNSLRLWHNDIDPFTHRRVYTQTLLHTDPFIHRHLYTQTLLHTVSQSLYTETLLHTDHDHYHDHHGHARSIINHLRHLFLSSSSVSASLLLYPKAENSILTHHHLPYHCLFSF